MSDTKQKPGRYALDQAVDSLYSWLEDSGRDEPIADSLRVVLDFARSPLLAVSIEHATCSEHGVHSGTVDCPDCLYGPNGEKLGQPHPSAQDLGLRDGVDDSCVHGRSVWSCPLCDARQLSELVALWGRDTAAAASCRRSVRMVWPELAERLDDLLDKQDGGDMS